MNCGQVSVSDYDQIVQELAVYFDDAPAPMIKRALIDAVRHLMKSDPEVRTFMLPVQAGVEDYDLNDMVYPWEVEQLSAVKMGGCCLENCDLCSQCGICWTYHTDGKLIIRTPPEDSTECFEITAVLTVPHTACAVPTKMVRRYREALVEQTKSKMYKMPGMPWHDRRAGAEAALASNSMMVDAMTHRALQGHQHHPIQRGTSVI